MIYAIIVAYLIIIVFIAYVSSQISLIRQKNIAIIEACSDDLKRRISAIAKCLGIRDISSLAVKGYLDSDLLIRMQSDSKHINKKINALAEALKMKQIDYWPDRVGYEPMNTCKTCGHEVKTQPSERRQK